MSAANYRRPTQEFLKRDSAGATKRLQELMQRPEWQRFPLRAEFEQHLYQAMGIEHIDAPSPDAA